MNSVIFRSATRYMFPILLLLSVFLLMSGHNEPGGGSAALGTPLLFDAGVFLDVIGVSLLIIFSMADVDRGES